MAHVGPGGMYAPLVSKFVRDLVEHHNLVDNITAALIAPATTRAIRGELERIEHARVTWIVLDAVLCVTVAVSGGTAKGEDVDMNDIAIKIPVPPIPDHVNFAMFQVATLLPVACEVDYPLRSYRSIVVDAEELTKAVCKAAAALRPPGA